MPENERKSENKVPFKQILELLGRPQNEQNAATRSEPSPQIDDRQPSRDIVLKVIESLKQV